MIMISVSGITFLVETVPNNGMNELVLYYMEIFFVSCFTLEYVCRLITCPSKKEFLSRLPIQKI